MTSLAWAALRVSMMKLTPVDLTDKRREGALMLDLENVAAGFADQGGGAGQIAGRVRHADLDRDQALGMHQAAQNDHRKEAQIDVAAAKDQADVAAGEALPVGS